MNSENIYNTWKDFTIKYKKLFNNNTEKWHNNLEQSKQFIMDNNRLPSRNIKFPEEKSLRLWINRQINNYKNKTQIMKQEEIQQAWEEFIEEYKEYF